MMSRYRLREDVTGKVMTDNLQYVFVELPKCVKREEDAKTVIDRFFYSLFNMSRMDHVPPGWDKDEIIKLLFDSAIIANFTPRERTKYIHDMTTQRDYENQLIFAAQKGLEKGYAKGKAEGKAEIASNMKRLGMPIETISLATGLSMEEISEL